MNCILKLDLGESKKIKQYNQTFQRHLLFEKTGPTQMVIEEEKWLISEKDISKKFNTSCFLR